MASSLLDVPLQNYVQAPTIQFQSPKTVDVGQGYNFTGNMEQSVKGLNVLQDKLRTEQKIADDATASEMAVEYSRRVNERYLQLKNTQGSDTEKDYATYSTDLDNIMADMLAQAPNDNIKRIAQQKLYEIRGSGLIRGDTEHSDKVYKYRLDTISAESLNYGMTRMDNFIETGGKDATWLKDIQDNCANSLRSIGITDENIIANKVKELTNTVTIAATRNLISKENFRLARGLLTNNQKIMDRATWLNLDSSLSQAMTNANERALVRHHNALKDEYNNLKEIYENYRDSNDKQKADEAAVELRKVGLRLGKAPAFFDAYFQNGNRRMAENGLSQVAKTRMVKDLLGGYYDDEYAKLKTDYEIRNHGIFDADEKTIKAMKATAEVNAKSRAIADVDKYDREFRRQYTYNQNNMDQLINMAVITIDEQGLDKFDNAESAFSFLVNNNANAQVLVQGLDENNKKDVIKDIQRVIDGVKAGQGKFRVESQTDTKWLDDNFKNFYNLAQLRQDYHYQNLPPKTRARYDGKMIRQMVGKGLQDFTFKDYIASCIPDGKDSYKDYDDGMKECIDNVMKMADPYIYQQALKDGITNVTADSIKSYLERFIRENSFDVMKMLNSDKTNAKLSFEQSANLFDTHEEVISDPEKSKFYERTYLSKQGATPQDSVSVKSAIGDIVTVTSPKGREFVTDKNVIDIVDDFIKQKKTQGLENLSEKLNVYDSYFAGEDLKEFELLKRDVLKVFNNSKGVALSKNSIDGINLRFNKLIVNKISYLKNLSIEEKEKFIRNNKYPLISKEDVTFLADDFKKSENYFDLLKIVNEKKIDQELVKDTEGHVVKPTISKIEDLMSTKDLMNITSSYVNSL